MNQIERRYVISVTMKYKSQIPKMIIKICQDLNISQLLEKIVRAYREEVNEEIFSDNNIPLFQLFYQQQQLENADLMSECLGQDGAYELEINYLMNSKNAKVLERIKKMDITISNFQTLFKQREYDSSCKKLIIAKYSPKDDPNLLPVQFNFKCIGEEVTLKDLKEKILNKYIEQYPLYQYFKKPHIFALKIQGQLFNDIHGNQILHDLFPQDTIQVSLEIHFPICKTLENFKGACRDLVYYGLDFIQGLAFIEEYTKNYEESVRQEVIESYIESSVVEFQTKANIVKDDQIREEYKKIQDYYDQEKKVFSISSWVCYGASNARKLKVLSNSLKLNSIVKHTLAANAVNYIGSKYIIGATAGLAVIQIAFMAYNLYSQNLSRADFVKRFIYCTSKCITYHVSDGIISATVAASLTAIGLGPFSAVLMGLLLGWSVDFLIGKGIEWIYKQFQPQDVCYNNLPELSQENLYYKSLQFVGCNKLTTLKEIKKRRLEMLKELHPDHTRERYDKAHFLQVLASFQIIIEYRYLKGIQSN